MYRALQHCPNQKTLYLDAIHHFPEQLQEFVDIMTDKQLRVRTTIEEVDLFVKNEMRQRAKAKADEVKAEAKPEQ